LVGQNVHVLIQRLNFSTHLLSNVLKILVLIALLIAIMFDLLGSCFASSKSHLRVGFPNSKLLASAEFVLESLLQLLLGLSVLAVLFFKVADFIVQLLQVVLESCSLVFNGAVHRIVLLDRAGNILLLRLQLVHRLLIALNLFVKRIDIVVQVFVLFILRNAFRTQVVESLILLEVHLLRLANLLLNMVDFTAFLFVAALGLLELELALMFVRCDKRHLLFELDHRPDKCHLAGFLLAVIKFQLLELLDHGVNDTLALKQLLAASLVTLVLFSISFLILSLEEIVLPLQLVDVTLSRTKSCDFLT